MKEASRRFESALQRGRCSFHSAPLLASAAESFWSLKCSFIFKFEAIAGARSSSILRTLLKLNSNLNSKGRRSGEPEVDRLECNASASQKVVARMAGGLPNPLETLLECSLLVKLSQIKSPLHLKKFEF